MKQGKITITEKNKGFKLVIDFKNPYKSRNI